MTDFLTRCFYGKTRPNLRIHFDVRLSDEEFKKFLSQNFKGENLVNLSSEISMYKYIANTG